eukprot:3265371-Pyramimonas_sp.AAC.1
MLAQDNHPLRQSLRRCLGRPIGEMAQDLRAGARCRAELRRRAFVFGYEGACLEERQRTGRRRAQEFKIIEI